MFIAYSLLRNSSTWLGIAQNYTVLKWIRKTLHAAELLKERRMFPVFPRWASFVEKRLLKTSFLTFFLDSTQFFLGKSISITTSILILYFGYSLRFRHNNVWLCAVQIRILKNSTKKILYAKFLYSIPPIAKHTLNLSVCMIRMSTQYYTMLQSNCR